MLPGREFVFEVTFFQRDGSKLDRPGEGGSADGHVRRDVLRERNARLVVEVEDRGGLALPRESVGESVRCAETGAAYGAKTRGSGKAGSVHSFKLFSAQRRRTAAPSISSGL